MAAAKGSPPATISRTSEVADFPSRSGTPAPRRRRTGRNVQLNIKATQSTIDRFTALCDARGWAFGEALDHALERDLA